MTTYFCSPVHIIEVAGKLKEKASLQGLGFHCEKHLER
ncbi:hypothetical protein BSM4216_3323 [Bacillus smithii]|nr:hypothetical protein BSM4216_3323 [Bacillus smithii]